MLIKRLLGRRVIVCEYTDNYIISCYTPRKSEPNRGPFINYNNAIFTNLLQWHGVGANLFRVVFST